MDRAVLIRHIERAYGIRPEHLWASKPSYAVFRHPENRKWFAALLDLPAEKLGLNQAGTVWVVNLKRDPLLVGALRQEPGIFPGYHMNKDHWISLCLNGSIAPERIKRLLQFSFELTAKKKGTR